MMPEWHVKNIEKLENIVDNFMLSSNAIQAFIFLIIHYTGCPKSP